MQLARSGEAQVKGRSVRQCVAATGLWHSYTSISQSGPLNGSPQCGATATPAGGGGESSRLYYNTERKLYCQYWRFTNDETGDGHLQGFLRPKITPLQHETLKGLCHAVTAATRLQDHDTHLGTDCFALYLRYSQSRYMHVAMPWRVKEGDGKPLTCHIRISRNLNIFRRTPTFTKLH